MGRLNMGNDHWLRYVAHSLTAHDIKARFELGQAESMLKTALSYDADSDRIPPGVKRARLVCQKGK